MTINVLLDVMPGGVLPITWRNAAKKIFRRRFLRRLPKHSVGAEIGVYYGGFSADLLDVVDPSRLYLIDPWLAQEGDGGVIYQIDQIRMDQIFSRVMTTVGSDPRVTVHRATSEVGAGLVADRSLDWVYIDGDHRYESVKRDLDLWMPKLVDGGLIAGDDYTWEPRLGHPVKRAVDELVASCRVVRVGVWRSQYVLRKNPNPQ